MEITSDAKQLNSQEDPDVRAGMAAVVDEIWSGLTEAELCGHLGTNAILHRWDSDEDYPDLSE